ncbi:flagellar protein FlgJ [Nitrosomonas sp. PY1]|uniref:flagellar assembly peptidoglycan hydrolase FlgJ n=1 Tax=Nitrosomonas sp. PY1 TaxID=1803906 RepID=UPI001FC813BB|nr:flagellar assembly peptidoglycan hydrolase FlgJ [Nitrosomonas sp. PY1]GKS68502.1 flagellar protein FlgJ [Nitrosomonas sp. PY1]
MIISPDISSRLAIDARSIDELQVLAKRNPDNALQKVAQQFEGLFMHMLLKSMREATPKDGLFDSQQTQFFTQMYDQQLAQHISKRGIGIADMMVKQLSRSHALGASISNEVNPTLPTTDPNKKLPIIPGMHPNDESQQLWPTLKSTPNISSIGTPNIANTRTESSSLSKQSELTNSKLSNQISSFIDRLLPHAKVATQSTGIPSQFILAQAALESGWGKHEIRRADNKPSYNLFGIKAGANWKGEVIETVTTEYINGAPQRIVEKFRAYNSYAEGFSDYAKLLSDNPRYAKVVKNTDAIAFANGLQQAGYATDPLYADKLIKIINNEAIQNRKFI